MHFAAGRIGPPPPRKFASWLRTNPARPFKFPRGGVAGVAMRFLVWKIGGQKIPRCEQHCAAKAEYGRLAAQAYSPSEAMPQARICQVDMQKVQRRSARISSGDFWR